MCFVEKGRICCHPRVRRDRQAANLEKGGVRKVAKEQDMHSSLFQISAARGRNREGGGWIQVKGKLPALLCSTDLWGPSGLETNILISASQMCSIARLSRSRALWLCCAALTPCCPALPKAKLIKTGFGQPKVTPSFRKKGWTASYGTVKHIFW